MVLRDVVDELHDDHGLAHPGTPEGAHLTALGKGADQVDDLDAGLEDLGRGRLVDKGRGGSVNRIALLVGHRTKPVHCVARHIEDTTQDPAAHRHGDRLAGVNDRHAALQAIGGCHGHGPDPPVTEVLLHFENESRLRTVKLIGYLNGVVDGRQLLST